MATVGVNYDEYKIVKSNKEDFVVNQARKNATIEWYIDYPESNTVTVSIENTSSCDLDYILTVTINDTDAGTESHSVSGKVLYGTVNSHSFSTSSGYSISSGDAEVELVPTDTITYNPISYEYTDF